MLRLLPISILALLLTTVPLTPARAGAPVYPTSAPMILYNVSWQDLSANVRGICNGSFTHVIKSVGVNLTTQSARNYLNIAQTCGLKVIFHFTETISTSGVVYPTRVAKWVNAVKSHPNLAGYLSVKEPSWVRVSATEIRSLYRAFRAADPDKAKHPVFALFGDIPHFGDSANPYTAGMADAVIVDWYPVETARSGCSRTGTYYITTGPKWYKTKVKPVVARKTPGTPIYVMVQTHKYLAPTCHKKQAPTQALLERQVREAFVYAGARGIAFHGWSNANYSVDQRRSPNLINWMSQISARVRAGAF